jgi:hypothetical protein
MVDARDESQYNHTLHPPWQDPGRWNEASGFRGFTTKLGVSHGLNNPEDMLAALLDPACSTLGISPRSPLLARAARTVPGSATRHSAMERMDVAMVLTNARLIFQNGIERETGTGSWTGRWPCFGETQHDEHITMVSRPVGLRDESLLLTNNGLLRSHSSATYSDTDWSCRSGQALGWKARAAC